MKRRGTVRLSIKCRGKRGEKARQQVWHTQELNRGRWEGYGAQSREHWNLLRMTGEGFAKKKKKKPPLKE